MHSELEPDDIGWLAMAVGVEPEPSDRCAAVDELGDAIILRADDQAERLTPAAVDAVWDDEIEQIVRRRLAEADDDEWEGLASAALADLDQRGRGSAVARAVIQQLAQSIASDDMSPFFCVCCLEATVAGAAGEERRRVACEAAALAARDIRVSDAELRRARRAPSGAVFARALAKGDRREAVRRRMHEIARTGSESVPALARELETILDDAPPEDAADDELWVAFCGSLTGRLKAAFN